MYPILNQLRVLRTHSKLGVAARFATIIQTQKMKRITCGSSVHIYIYIILFLSRCLHPKRKANAQPHKQMIFFSKTWLILETQPMDDKRSSSDVAPPMARNTWLENPPLTSMMFPANETSVETMDFRRFHEVPSYKMGFSRKQTYSHIPYVSICN